MFERGPRRWGRHLLRRLPVRRVVVLADAVPAVMGAGGRHRGDGRAPRRPEGASPGTRRHGAGWFGDIPWLWDRFVVSSTPRRLRSRHRRWRRLADDVHAATRRADPAAVRALRQRVAGRALLPRRGGCHAVPASPVGGDRLGRQRDPPRPADGVAAPAQLRHVSPRPRVATSGSALSSSCPMRCAR